MLVLDKIYKDTVLHRQARATREMQKKHLFFGEGFQVFIFHSPNFASLGIEYAQKFLEGTKQCCPTLRATHLFGVSVKISCSR